MNRPVSSDDGGYWRIAIVEDHVLQRRGARDLLDAQQGLTVVQTCETLTALLTWLDRATVRTRPHLVLLDLGVDDLRVRPAQIHALIRFGIRVLALSDLTSPAVVREIVQAGVHGVLSKRDSEPQVVAAVWAVLGRQSWYTPRLDALLKVDAGRPSLSDQEERAMILYGSGATVKVVAETLGVRPGTAKKYLERVKAKYAAVGRPVRTKLQMSREAQRDGLIDR